jgi:hypothetical protein
MTLKVFLRRLGRSAAITLLGLTILFHQPPAEANDTAIPREWPPIRLGLWKLETTRTLPKGKTKHSTETARACSDGRDIFTGYWGGGIVEIEGCEYHPIKVATDAFRITTECIVRGLRSSNGTTEVTMHGREAFELKGTVTEGKRTYRVTQVGHRLSDCPAIPSQSPHAEP